MLFRIFIIIFFICKSEAFGFDSFFKTEEPVINEVSEDEYIQQEQELLQEPIDEDNKIDFISKKGIKDSETCTFYQNANLQITNKIEGKTYIQNVKVNEDFRLEFLKIKLTKCCKTEAESSYAFAKIYNDKAKKEIFFGWIASSFPSKNPIEDKKFDIILLQCF